MAKVVKVKPVGGGTPSAAMAFNFGQCINCERAWSSEGHKAEKWYKVQDWEVVRWVCYRCTDKLWKRAASACIHQGGDVDYHLRRQEFQSDMQACLEEHKRRHPPTVEMEGDFPEESEVMAASDNDL